MLAAKFSCRPVPELAVGGEYFGARAGNRPHRREYRPGTTVQQASRRLLPPSTSLLTSSCPAVAFLSCHLWLAAAAGVTCTGRATLTSCRCTGVSSSATQCHVVAATSTWPHGPSNCNWPPEQGSGQPAQATWQAELWLAVGDLYPHPAGPAWHRPAWHTAPHEWTGWPHLC